MSGDRKPKIASRDFRLYYGDFLALKGLTVEFAEHPFTAIIGRRVAGSPRSPEINRNERPRRRSRVSEDSTDGANVYDHRRPAC